MQGNLKLQSGLEFIGESFGADKSISGELVFATGMVGYPEALTDPSFKGQILVMTYPLIGNYGVPDRKFWESDKIQVSGLIVSNYIDTPSHFASKSTLAKWLKQERIPALEIKDTRMIAKHLAEKGSSLGKLAFDTIERGFEDPNLRNLVSEVSVKKPKIVGKGKKTVVLIDCGTKRNIIRELESRGVKILIVPWDMDFKKIKIKYHGVVVSNGPGDPKMAGATISTVKNLLKKKQPILGICLGNQILALSAGGDTYKLKFGHRSQNQPCLLLGTRKCFLTTQNHGFAVGKIPQGFRAWFVNANDGTNEGIIHKTLPFMSVQFHPESSPGPMDTAWVFDEFIRKIG
ncbi:MAG: glutamine-hydrolyzing carbamoyl-phosphate synthase small subunit [Patescibacteria group bacterium]